MSSCVLARHPDLPARKAYLMPDNNAAASHRRSSGSNLHYAWVITAIALLMVLGAIGLARFAFGMLLPSMAADLGLDYQQQGFLSAAYFVGYLAIVAILPWLAPILGPRKLCAGGMIAIGFSLLAMSAGRSFEFVAASYFMTGLGSGAGLVGAMSLASFWFYPSHRARGAGVTVAGAGIGMVFSGFLVPRVTDGLGGEPWQLIWAGFGFIEIILGLVAAWYLRSRPSDMGLMPFGRPPAMAKSDHVEDAQADDAASAWPRMFHLGAIYFLFGVTCLTYATFIVTSMVDHLGVDAEEAGFLWACVGGLSIFSGAIFGLIADRFGHHIGMLSAFFVQAIAYGLVANDWGSSALYVSLVLFGLSAWSLPPIIAAAVGDYLGAERAAGGFAVVTFMFAIGQVLGPAGAGVLAGLLGDFALSYGLAVGLNTMAIILCIMLGLNVRQQRSSSSAAVT